MKKIILISLLTILFAGCDQQKEGPLEKAGERADEIGDNIKEGKAPLHQKGTMEKAGESVDKTLHTDKDN